MTKQSLNNAITNYTLSVNGNKYSIDELLGIEEVDISTEFATHPARFAYIGALLAEADNAWKLSKQDTEYCYAQLDSKVRRDKTQKGTKITETGIKNHIIQEDAYQELIVVEVEAHKEFLTMKYLFDSLRERGQMLISLGANLRQEFESQGLHINKRVN